MAKTKKNEKNEKEIVQEEKKDALGRTLIKCQYCGKWIRPKEDADETDAGDYCRELHQKFTPEELEEIKLSLTADEVPRGWVKLAAAGRICRKHGIPVNRLVKAIGGDRGIEAPLHPKFQPKYVGNSRWIDPWCVSEEGLKFLKNLSSGRSKKGEEDLADILGKANK
jgi:hypothetical protein